MTIATGMRCGYPGGRESKRASDSDRSPVGNEFGMGLQDKITGRLKQAAGDLTDDKDLKREGQADEAGGKVKEGVDKVKDALTGKDR